MRKGGEGETKDLELRRKNCTHTCSNNVLLKFTLLNFLSFEKPNGHQHSERVAYLIPLGSR